MNTLPIRFHTAPYELFFKKEPDYSLITPKFEILDLMARMNNISICVLDFYKHEYAYISKDHVFMCGYSMEDCKLYGEKLAEKIIYEDDKVNQADMKDAACLFMLSLNKETLKKLSLYTTHRLIHKNGSIYMVSNHYKPFEFDDKGKMWLAVCSTTLSTKNHRIESYIEILGNEERYVFSPTKKEFIKSKSLKLSTKEHQILIFSSQGYTSKEIAEKMAISLNTIKFHKQNILVKLNVQNISEACLYAFAHNLF